MKNKISMLLFALALCATADSYSRSRYIEIDDEDDVEIVYERPSYRRCYRYRPYVREVVYEPIYPTYREVRYVDSNPGASFFSGFFGGLAGTAIANAICD